jgi:hypothetical protein
MPQASKARSSTPRVAQGVLVEDAGESVGGKPLKRVTIAVRGFPYRKEIDHAYEPGTVAVEHAIAMIGETVELLPPEFERGMRLNAFLREGQDINILTGKELPRESPSELPFSAQDATDTELINWIKDVGPKVQEVIDASEGDAETAARLLMAESAATGNDPRKGVIMGLEAVVRRSATQGEPKED